MYQVLTGENSGYIGCNLQQILKFKVTTHARIAFKLNIPDWVSRLLLSSACDYKKNKIIRAYNQLPSWFRFGCFQQKQYV